MSDGLDRGESRERLPGEEDPSSVEGVEAEEKIARLEGLIAQRGEELAEANARLTGLEQAIADKDNEISNLTRSVAETEERRIATGDSLGEAVAAYKAMVVQANPEAVGELISGDTIEAINDSLEKAKTLVNKVRQGVEAEISWNRVPAGAPGRTTLDLSALSPREKIQHAIRA